MSARRVRLTADVSGFVAGMERAVVVVERFDGCAERPTTTDDEERDQ